MRLYSRFLHLALLLFVPHAVFAASYYGDGGYVDADLGVRYESNLSRANNDSDIEEDMVTALSAGAGYLKGLDEKSQLLISAYLAHENFAEFKDLNNTAVNAVIVYTIQPKAGYTQPWYELSVDIAKQKYNKSNIRDSVIVNAKLAVGKRLTDRIVAKFAYNYEHRGSDADVFDTDNHEVDLALLYSYSPTISFFGNYSLRLGEVVSTATPNPAIIAAAERVAADDVFAPGFGPGCANRRCAYRLDALSHIFETGVELSLTRLVSLDLSGRYFFVDGNDLDAYKGWIYSASLYLQF